MVTKTQIYKYVRIIMPKLIECTLSNSLIQKYNEIIANVEQDVNETFVLAKKMPDTTKIRLMHANTSNLATQYSHHSLLKQQCIPSYFLLISITRLNINNIVDAAKFAKKTMFFLFQITSSTSHPLKNSVFNIQV